MTPSVNTLCNEKLFVCNKQIHQDVASNRAVMSSIILLSPVKKSSESGEKYAHQAPFTNSFKLISVDGLSTQIVARIDCKVKKKS